ncbi:MAG: hypothetical protein J6D38_09415, partial [Solobacterium sp.]|nr:hypothetical protein [Solobacterium sp.]
MAKRKRRGVSPILVLLLTVLAAGLAAGWNYVAAIKTKYEGKHPFWSKQEYLKLSEDSLEYKVAQRVLKTETLKRFAAVNETNGNYGTALAEQTGSEETAATEDGIYIEHVNAGTYEGFMIVVPDPDDVSIV